MRRLAIGDPASRESAKTSVTKTKWVSKLDPELRAALTEGSNQTKGHLKPTVPLHIEGVSISQMIIGERTHFDE